MYSYPRGASFDWIHIWIGAEWIYRKSQDAEQLRKDRPKGCTCACTREPLPAGRAATPRVQETGTES